MNNEFYSKNRWNTMGEKENGSCLILFAGKPVKKTADEKYQFAPNRNFLYLTGINEADPILYIEKVEEGIKECLFINRYDEVRAKWLGETINEEDSTKVSGIKEIKYLDEFQTFIHQKISSGQVNTFYFDMEKDGYDEEYLIGGKFALNLKQDYPFIEIRNIYNDIASLRQIKSEGEIENITKAINITNNAIKEVMKNAKEGMFEYEAESYFDFNLKKAGVKDFAFKTICASGKNATVLHYSSNDSVIPKDALLLLDLGAQWENYSGDISRTFPVSGKFTEKQKMYYDIVIKAHDAVIKAAKPGLPFLRMNEIVKEVYAEELKKVGLIKEDKEVFKYYFHGVSHHLGLDTHDVGRRDNLLKEGMVFTVEPGLYIPEESIGIRVEDDVLITKDGCKILGDKMIRTSDEIEAFLKDNQIK